MTEQQNKLPQIPKGWAWTTLGDMAEKVVDGSHNPPPKQKSGLPMLSARNILNGKIVFSKYRTISKEDFEKEIRRTPIEVGDVLLTIVGTIGRSTVVRPGTPRFALQRSVALIKTKTNSKYLSFLLQSPTISSYLFEKARGTAQKGVYLNQLNNLPLPIPPLPEQSRIVDKVEELFTRLDASVESFQRIKAQLRRYRQAVQKHAFKGKLTEEWRGTHRHQIEPSQKLLERIKEEHRQKTRGKHRELPPIDTSNLPEIPEDWVWARVGEISETIHYGYTASSSTQPVGPRMLRITDIQENAVDWDTVPYCRIDESKAPKYLLKEGDLVFARTGATVGKSYLIKGKIPEAVFASYLIRIILLNNVSKEFVYDFFQSPSYWLQIRKKQVGIGQPNVNSQTLSRIILPFPPLLEQDKIVEEIESRLPVADETAKVAEKSLKQTERLRQSILKKAFEGKLVPQNPNDEPAEKLLERIREGEVYV